MSLKKHSNKTMKIMNQMTNMKSLKKILARDRLDVLDAKVSLFKPNNAAIQLQRVLPHTVRPSPWPFCLAMSTGSLLLSLVSVFNFCPKSGISLLISTFFTLSSLYFWFNDIIYESYEGQHTILVKNGMHLGFLLFILSEVMFFVSFFWAFFHYSLSPSTFILNVWPPKGIMLVSAWGIPFLNTVLLLSSGVFLTTSHRILLCITKNKLSAIKYSKGVSVSGNVAIKNFLFDMRLDFKGYLFCTIIFGLIFTFFQFYEYMHSTFSINDSVYGSIFYLATGFHGLHVLVGTLFLLVTLFRYRRFSHTDHLGFECAAYYWHFVDVVWLFLFIMVYWWGS